MTIKKKRKAPNSKRGRKRCKVKKRFVYADEPLALTKAGAQFIMQTIDKEYTPNQATIEARKLNADIPRL